MNQIDGEFALRQLSESLRHMVARPRELAARLGELAPPDACEVMTWLQPHVDRLLGESDRVLEGIDAET